ncbi:glycosyltransferase [Lyngbya sp. CCY1209]|uniref:glycosyltransferase n=1 Tax=Lyngbya sp. CCY1209 TaxID=2886103 RepID=UPI002D20DA60|nr:glycosyltransferase [Lyngbya sp. CCY1209]MEB3886918.1 glycosyltransferase family 2 protein [Lyngbya sp. CCY1209]
MSSKVYITTQIKSTSNITIFAVPKSFHGDIGIIQRNAILSWSLLKPKPEIILLGDENGTKRIADEFNIIHLSSIKCNHLGTPMLDDVFAKTKKIASNKILAYVNSDIILTQDFSTTVQQVATNFSEFLLIGRRWNIDLKTAIDFRDLNLEKKLKKLIWDRGILASETAKDYFVFPKHLFSEMPEFAIGRGYWDNWMVNRALEKSYPVIDGSQTIFALHQNHSYTHVRGSKTEAYFGKEAERNKVIGKVEKSGSIGISNYQTKPFHLSRLPRVSVVIFDLDERIVQKINDILSRESIEVEFLLIATDRAKEKHIIDRLHFPKISKVFREKENELVTKNRAIEIAKGEFIVFLKGDCCLLPGMLNKQVSYFDDRSSTVDVLLSGWQRGEGETVLELEPWKLLPDLEDIHIWKFWQLWQPLRESAIMFRRDRLEMFGGFDPRLHPVAANIEVVLRMVLLRGSKVAWLPEATCHCDREREDWENVVAMASDIESVVNCFFERSLVPEWMRELESRARYHVMVWLGWLMYEAGEKERMAEYLGRSLSYSPYQTQQTAVSWVQRFKKFAESSGEELGERSALDLLLKYFDIAEGR